MTAAHATEFKRLGTVTGKYTMGAVISLLLNNESAELFMESLPSEFLTTLAPLNEKLQNPLLWEVSDFFRAVVVDFQAVGYASLPIFDSDLRSLLTVQFHSRSTSRLNPSSLLSKSTCGS